MNTNSNSNNRKMNSQVLKTFCKVCQDSGKTEKEYTSHNVRDAKGTKCPTLLAQECRNCYKIGHTIKYCPIVKAPFVIKVAYKPVPVPVKQVMPKNVFMLLESDSEDEKEDEVQQKLAPTPVLHANLKAVQKQAMNFKNIISLTEQQVKAAVIAEAIKALEPEPKKKAAVIVTPKIKINWADAVSDSSGDEEEDYYEDNSSW